MKTLYDKCVEITEETLSEGHLVRTSLMRKMNLDKVSQDDFDKQYVNYNFYYVYNVGNFFEIFFKIFVDNFF